MVEFLFLSLNTCCSFPLECSFLATKHSQGFQHFVFCAKTDYLTTFCIFNKTCHQKRFRRGKIFPDPSYFFPLPSECVLHFKKQQLALHHLLDLPECRTLEPGRNHDITVFCRMKQQVVGELLFLLEFQSFLSRLFSKAATEEKRLCFVRDSPIWSCALQLDTIISADKQGWNFPLIRTENRQRMETPYKMFLARVWRFIPHHW